MISFITASAFFGPALCIAAYMAGIAVRRRFPFALCNPLLIAIILVIAVLSFFKIPYGSFEASAKYLSWWLTPATVCLALPLYRELETLRKNAAAIAAGITAGVAASAMSIFIMAWSLGTGRQLYVTLLPKSITTAIGMGVSAEAGGIVTLTVASIIITGIIGNIAAEPLLRLFGITEPVARGIAIGTSSHAIGTVKALEMGSVEGAMSSLAVAAAGLMTVIVVPLAAMLY